MLDPRSSNALLLKLSALCQNKGEDQRKMKKGVLIIAWLVIFFSLLVCIIFGERGAIDLYRLKSESDRLARTNAVLKKENQKLYRNIDRLKNDLKYIEEVAREDLGMVARDEVIYQFKEEKEKKE